MPSDKFNELMREHGALSHAVQSGVAIEYERKGPEAQKHLRVGINVAMCDHAALVRLLVAKGVFTEEEYAVEAVKSMKEEVERYEASCSELLSGATVHLT